MRVYRAKRLQGYEQKGSQYNFCADHFETKQCTWTGNWLYANRN